MNISISIYKILKMFSYIIIILTFLSVSSQIYKFELNNGEDRYITDMLNFDKESNFPTLYATLTLFFCSLMLFVITYSKKTTNDKYYIQWFLLGFLFFLMATDEILMLHEQLSSPIRSVLKTEHIIFFSWVIPAVIFIIIFFISYLRFLKNLPDIFRNLFLTSGVIYIFGAVGMEIIGSRIVTDYGQDNLFYALITNVEELFEMIGILLFIYTLLSYIKTYLNNFSLKLVD